MKLYDIWLNETQRLLGQEVQMIDVADAISGKADGVAILIAFVDGKPYMRLAEGWYEFPNYTTPVSLSAFDC